MLELGDVDNNYVDGTEYPHGCHSCFGHHQSQSDNSKLPQRRRPSPWKLGSRVDFTPAPRSKVLGRDPRLPVSNAEARSPSRALKLLILA
jgi:hypothetical protein